MPNSDGGGDGRRSAEARTPRGDGRLRGDDDGGGGGGEAPTAGRTSGEVVPDDEGHGGGVESTAAAEIQSPVRRSEVAAAAHSSNSADRKRAGRGGTSSLPFSLTRFPA